MAPVTVIALHALLSDGLIPDPSACGRIRSRAVEIGGSVYLPVALPQRLDRSPSAQLASSRQPVSNQSHGTQNANAKQESPRH